MTSYTQSERNIISNRQGKNEKYREPTATVNSRQKDLEFSRNTAFLQQRKTSSKFRVPFIPDADVGADDFSSQRCRRISHMQGLRTVKGHGQACAGSLSAEMLADRKMSFPPRRAGKRSPGALSAYAVGEVSTKVSSAAAAHWPSI